MRSSPRLARLARFVARALALALGAAAAACAGPPAEPLTSDRVSNATWITITDDGAGTVRSGTPYREDAMAGIAQGADIRSIQTAVEDRTTWTHAAFIGEVQAVQFFKGAGGTVGEMHGVTQHLAGPNGERIGMTMAQARVRRRDCRNGRKLWRGMAVCRARGSDRVRLVFAIPGYEGPFDRLPSAGDLERAELQRIVWRAR